MNKNTTPPEQSTRKLWGDLNTDAERLSFLESGRAWDTGIISPAIIPDVIDLIKYRIDNTRIHLTSEEISTIRQSLVAAKAYYRLFTNKKLSTFLERIDVLDKKMERNK